jgi:hypothetical protein
LLTSLLAHGPWISCLERVEPDWEGDREGILLGNKGTGKTIVADWGDWVELLMIIDVSGRRNHNGAGQLTRMPPTNPLPP